MDKLCNCYFCNPSSYDRLFMEHAMFIDSKPHEGCFFCQNLDGLSEADRFKRFDEFIQAKHG